MIERENAKDTLTRSYVDLLSRLPVNKVTVEAVAANCGMSKRTFYNHFTGKDELLKYLVGKMVARRFNEWRQGSCSYVEMQARVFADAVHMMPSTGAVMGNEHGLGSAFQEIASATMIAYEEYLKEALGKEQLDERILFELRFSCRACMMALSDWTRSDQRISLDEFAEWCVGCMPEGLRQYFI